MEVSYPYQYEREEARLMGRVDETSAFDSENKVSHPTNTNSNSNSSSSNNKNNSKPLSPTISDSGDSCVSNESCGDSNLEYLVKSDAATTPTIIINTETTINGEFHKLPVLEDTPAENAHINNNNNNKVYFDETTAPLTQGRSSFPVHQNGGTVAHSLQESRGGGGGEAFSNNAVGLQYFESMLNEASSDVGSTDAAIVGNGIVNQNTNAVLHQAEEMDPQVEEYDVEKVIQKQETHDLFCPNCRSCITKRVILRRRKRKFPEISTAEEASGLGHDQSGLPAASDDIAEESQRPPQDDKAPDSRLDAISCFSCFSIFIPSGEGFLCWRFKPKPGTALQPDGTSAGIGQAEDSKTDSTGTIFPLWVVTCCQPAERETPEASPLQTEPPLPQADDVLESSTPGSRVPEHSLGLPYVEGTQHDARTTLQNKPLNPVKPSGDAPSRETETPSNITSDEGSNFPLWILTCCQPSTMATNHPVKLDGNEPAQETSTAASGDAEPNHIVSSDKTTRPRETPSVPFGGTESNHLAKPDGNEPAQETPTAASGDAEPNHIVNSDKTTRPWETPSVPFGGTESNHLAKPDKTVPQEEIGLAPSGGTRPPLIPSDDNPSSPFNPESPAIFVPGTSTPSKPITKIEPIDDFPLPPQTESPAASGNAVLPMPFKPQPPVVPSDSHEAEILVDVEAGPTQQSRRRGVSGLDIIKATVYGGLLESITSLSVITSAAGGDATTLNIVALGLANVLGGLVVLIHNLRVLKHEHTTAHYEAQLGRPGHYMLHAVVAIVSYLVFGLMSPIIYGFAFRKSDNKDYKLATLAAAALACITLLSVAKAYVRNPPKAYIKTVFYYVSLGVMVSGLGYVAGDVINTLLKKLGVFDPRAPDNVPVLAGGVTKGAWSSF
ncbi:hypothetical protein vseg_014472 [Gypsophila vaccaria]